MLSTPPQYHRYYIWHRRSSSQYQSKCRGKMLDKTKEYETDIVIGSQGKSKHAHPRTETSCIASASSRPVKRIVEAVSGISFSRAAAILCICAAVRLISYSRQIRPNASVVNWLVAVCLNEHRWQFCCHKLICSGLVSFERF